MNNGDQPCRMLSPACHLRPHSPHPSRGVWSITICLEPFDECARIHSFVMFERKQELDTNGAHALHSRFLLILDDQCTVTAFALSSPARGTSDAFTLHAPNTRLIAWGEKSRNSGVEHRDLGCDDRTFLRRYVLRCERAKGIHLVIEESLSKIDKVFLVDVIHQALQGPGVVTC